MHRFASHRLNLVVMEVYSNHLNKVHELLSFNAYLQHDKRSFAWPFLNRMDNVANHSHTNTYSVELPILSHYLAISIVVRLNSIKNRHKLRLAGANMPVMRNATCWCSTHNMVARYQSIRDNIDRSDDAMANYCQQHARTCRSSTCMEILENKTVQSSTITLADVRVLFDSVVEHFPVTAEYLSPSADIVETPALENGLVKLLHGQESALTASEKLQLARRMLSRRQLLTNQMHHLQWKRSTIQLSSTTTSLLTSSGYPRRRKTLSTCS
ncbi:TPA: hypothetical protein N0F65_009110 [Lagenidium giganteum]|uniref:Uncharacterized protein n=1 Tax=Lagenidium giganteum TaxID=4803 RepID=A0AAV2YRL8_9STRA|nr:TPA: hypothetical protein N0F65_009110 [Lagenidium giganteum]